MADTEPEEVEAPKRPKVKKTPVIKDAKIVRTAQTGVSPPCLLYEGAQPSLNETIKFELDNGVTYKGVVADVTSADGQVLVEFKDGITPV